MGPTASQIAIKQLGTNGGGFFNSTVPTRSRADVRWPILSRMVALLAIPATQTDMYGLMARDTKQGWTLFGAMAILFFMGVTTAYYFEAKPNPVMQGLAVDQTVGNMEGKEVRYGVANSGDLGDGNDRRVKRLGQLHAR